MATLATTEAAQSHGLIEQYEAIANASRRMAAAARNDRWDEFERLQQHCARLIDALRAEAARHALDAAGGARRIALLSSMLVADADIRELAEPGWQRYPAWLTGRAPH